MEKFKEITSNIAVLEIDNIDTDMIIPKQFLKTLKKSGLGTKLFYEMRYNEQEQIIPEFILNKQEFSKAQILLAGSNFGCGSSREHAPWAIVDFGIKIVIANSFADIFHGNCFKNGILPIVLAKDETDALKSYISKEKNSFIVNLEKQTVESEDGDFVIKFEITPQRKKILIEGLDDIAETLQYSNLIDKFEAEDRKNRPWIYE